MTGQELKRLGMAIGALVKPILYVFVLLNFALLFYYGAWPVVSNEVMSRINSGKSVPLCSRLRLCTCLNYKTNKIRAGLEQN